MNEKGKNYAKQNCNPVNILSTLSKIYEKACLNNCLTFLKIYFLSTGYSKDFSTQQCSLTLFKKCKSIVDNGHIFSALLNNISKASDCPKHEILIARLNTDGFSLPALRLIQNYLSNRKQRVRVNDSYSLRQEMLLGVPQESLLSFLLLNIILEVFFFTLSTIELANNTDDTTPYVISNNTHDLIESLETFSKYLLKQFYDNLLKRNSNKCNYLKSSHEDK